MSMTLLPIELIERTGVKVTADTLLDEWADTPAALANLAEELVNEVLRLRSCIRRLSVGARVAGLDGYAGAVEVLL